VEIQMRRLVWLPALVVLAVAVRAGADDKEPAKEAPKNARFDQLKKLAGEWYAADDKGKATDKLVTVFKVISNGSAIQETIHPGQPFEMVTVYHLDGKDVTLTHYCALGNQPRLKLDPKSPTNQLKFQFVGGTNLDPAKDMHMHEGSITVIDDDHIEWAWQAYANGKPMEDHKMSLKLVRKK
jgi:hypothetical protein